MAERNSLIREISQIQDRVNETQHVETGIGIERNIISGGSKVGWMKAHRVFLLRMNELVADPR